MSYLWKVSPWHLALVFLLLGNPVFNQEHGVKVKQSRKAQVFLSSSHPHRHASDHKAWVENMIVQARDFRNFDEPSDFWEHSHFRKFMKPHASQYLSKQGGKKQK